MKTLAIIITAATLAGCFGKFRTPQELATASKCDPAYIASWQDAVIEYPKSPKAQGTYLPASVIMERGWGDCKGYAAISEETMLECGAEAHIIRLVNPDKKKGHAITVFTLKDGRRGFINQGQSKTYPADIPWVKIVSEVGDGHWTAQIAEGI